jgi:hypothetical protein
VAFQAVAGRISGKNDPTISRAIETGLDRGFARKLRCELKIIFPEGAEQV